MAYFLKKTNNKKGTYLQIYESFYDPERGHTAHHSYKALGYIHELKANGIENPEAHYRAYISELNKKRKDEKESKKSGRFLKNLPKNIKVLIVLKIFFMRAKPETDISSQSLLNSSLKPKKEW